MSRIVEFEIALSFAGEDRVYVDQVANLLRDSGIKVFYDLFEEANLWGKNLYDYLSGIYKDKALFTIMFISEHYADKLWPTHERQAMQSRAFGEHREYVLPARFDDTPIPGVLPTVAYISLVNLSPAAFVELIKKKLIRSGRTIPSDSIRRALFATSMVPRVDPITSRVAVVSSDGLPIANAAVLAIADNKTTKQTTTDADGRAVLTIPTRRLYQLLVAHPDYPGAIVSSWDPKDDVSVTLVVTGNTGSALFASTGHIPALEGRLNPILDAQNRTYLYADNIAIDGGKQQPTPFEINVPFELEDCNGVLMEVRVLHIQGPHLAAAIRQVTMMPAHRAGKTSYHAERVWSHAARREEVNHRASRKGSTVY